MYRIREGTTEVLLGHPGGPYFHNKDDGFWTIPKGEPGPGEDLFGAAQREFAEETGIAPHGFWIALAPIQQKGGKIVHAWAFEGDCDVSTLRSNMFRLEWPPRSGRQQEFAELDRIQFFPLDLARRKIKARQEAFLDELERILENDRA